MQCRSGIREPSSGFVAGVTCGRYFLSTAAQSILRTQQKGIRLRKLSQKTDSSSSGAAHKQTKSTPPSPGFNNKRNLEPRTGPRAKKLETRPSFFFVLREPERSGLASRRHASHSSPSSANTISLPCPPPPSSSFLAHGINSAG